MQNISFQLLICVIFSSIFGCSSSNTQDEVVTGKDDNEVFQLPQDLTQVPYNGLDLVKAEQKGAKFMLREGDLKDGQRHGSWITYNEDGGISSLETYYKGEKQGVSLIFNQRGTIKSKAYYHKDQLHGETLVYSPSGVVIEQKTYNNGKLEGSFNKFYNDGSIMQESVYNNGQLNGIAKWYDQEGNLSIAYEYQDGELINKDPELGE